MRRAIVSALGRPAHHGSDHLDEPAQVRTRQSTDLPARIRWRRDGWVIVSVLSRLLPPAVEGRYRGSISAIVILSLIVLVKMAQGLSVAGLNPWKSGRSILETVDGVPLSEFPVEASDHLVFLFAVWGLCVFILCLFGLIALLRYRALVPLALLLLLFEQLGRKVLAATYLGRPFFSSQLDPAAVINWAFLVAVALGFLLSISTRTKGP